MRILNGGLVFGLLACLVSNGIGQGLVKIINENIYIVQRFEKNHTDAVKSCETHNAIPANLTNSTVRTSLFQAISKSSIWKCSGSQTCNQSTNAWVSASNCQHINLVNGLVQNAQNCSELHNIVCMGKAWSNQTMAMKSRIAFSEVKLRHTDARQVCINEGKRVKMDGKLVTVTSEQMQKILNDVIKGESFISNDNKKATNTKGYQNWVTEKSPEIEGSECIKMERNGRWDNEDCYSYLHYICEFNNDSSFTMTSTQEPTETTQTQPANTTTKTGKTNPLIQTTTMETTTSSASTRISPFLFLHFAIAILIWYWNIH